MKTVPATSIADSIRSQLAPINSEGYRFIAAFAVASLILFWLWTPLGWLGVIATAWCVYFFRDPPRVTPLREGNGLLERWNGCCVENAEHDAVLEKKGLTPSLAKRYAAIRRIPPWRGNVTVTAAPP